MQELRHLLRMARWAKRPPSQKRVILVISVIVISLVIVGIERWIGFPDWMAVQGGRPKIVR
ncbi:hypothetical protein FTO60_07760 [Octadecabacter sp. SW4]|uniref:hypothetical protein n=1 Tax=Octadecabacter sp. SW4 TaxID=2602067 RepID=UPI0011C206E5|nr:hypothetical protein [Octadecabacter sp. SW4]QEE35610.1 hypothetical protein FTO60_07760 [Octadecabacter sp. SW4]|tara:strand:+ start:1159 stop:1341 length:183 start_codon:yes stop_codon:yes gene_type:complete